jgi:hypothetical protein
MKKLTLVLSAAMLCVSLTPSYAGDFRDYPETPNYNPEPVHAPSLYIPPINCPPLVIPPMEEHRDQHYSSGYGQEHFDNNQHRDYEREHNRDYVREERPKFPVFNPGGSAHPNFNPGGPAKLIYAKK